MNEIIDKFIAKKYGLKNGRLLIADYYEALRNDLDILTEEILQKAAQTKKSTTTIDFDKLNKEKKRPPRSNKQTAIEIFEAIEDNMINRDVKDPYDDKYEYEWKMSEKTSNLEEYVNAVRRETLNELKKVEKRALTVFEQQRNLIESASKRTDAILDKAKLDEFLANLCNDSFAFMLKFGTSNEFDFFKDTRSKIFTIVTDFYLNQSQIEFIKYKKQYKIGNFI
jgi:hypothetical protein